MDTMIQRGTASARRSGDVVGARSGRAVKFSARRLTPHWPDPWTTLSTSPSSTTRSARWSASSRATTSLRSPRELDRTSTFPWDNIKAMGELGLLGVPWGEELGGAGMDQLSYYITIHEMAKVDASHALTISAHTNLGTSPIVEFGTEEQKRRYVPLLASGQVLGGFGLTEPGAGSDAGGTATTAVDKGDHYLLNGSKIFITHAGVGEIFVSPRGPSRATATRGSPASSSPRTRWISTSAASWG